MRDWDTFNEKKHYREKVAEYRALGRSRTGRRSLRMMAKIRAVRNKGRTSGLVTVADQLRGE